MKPLSSTAVPAANSQRMIKCWVGFNRPQMCDNWIYTCAVIKQYLCCIKLLHTGTFKCFFQFSTHHKYLNTVFHATAATAFHSGRHTVGMT